MNDDELSRYCAWAVRHDGPGHGHVVQAASFAEAAMAFVELWHPEPDAADAVTVMVLDQHSGERQCFEVGLSAGEAEPCR